MTAITALPDVHLEVRLGSGRSATYALDHVDFLIGAVPGCDLRVAGADLPPLLCIIARQPGGARLRKLAPTQILLVNGQTPSTADLADGDRITLGAIDIFVRIEGASQPSSEIEKPVEKAPVPKESPAARQELQKQLQAFRAQVVRFQEEKDAFLNTHQQREAELSQREQALEDEAAELEKEKTYWYERRAEIEREITAPPAAAAPTPEPATVPVVAAKPAVTEAVSKADRTQALDEIEKQRQQLAVEQQELADIRKQLYERYQERRDRLAGLKDAVDKAAQKVQERKREVDQATAELSRERARQTERHAELERRAQEMAGESDRLECERRLLTESQNAVQTDLAERLQDLQERETRLTAHQRDIAAKLDQYQTDLVRFDRRQGEVEKREAEVQKQAVELAQSLEQLKLDSAELETQAANVEEWRTQLTEESERLATQKQDQDTLAAQLAQRAALLEGQQATLAALRTRLERVRDEVRRQEQQLDEQRSRQESVEADNERETQALLKLKTELENEEKLRDQERQQLAERSAVLETAVAQLKQARNQLGADEDRLRQRLADADQRQATVAEQENVLQGRLQQIAETQQRLDAERQALRERTLAQTQAEQVREALQEQLRRRGEELAQRQKALHDQVLEFEAKTRSFADKEAQIEAGHQTALAQVEEERKGLAERVAEFDRRHAELQKLETKHADHERHVQEMGRRLDEQEQALTLQQEENQRAWQEKQEEQAAARIEFDALRLEARRLVQLLPDAELRAGTALDRVAHAREQLRDHLSEIHAYVRQCQDEFEAVRGKLQTEASALGQEEKSLRRGQEEHRLALAAFRQQLIDWQGQMGDLKRSIVRGENKLERREAEMVEQVKGLDVAAQRLARQADAVGQQQQAVAAQRSQLDQHLVDMRQWYRSKLRDLAGIPALAGDLYVPEAEMTPPSSASEPVTPTEENQEAITPTNRDILSITEPLDPGDLKLGDTLKNLQLIDGETLTALLIEARRQRRSLRQVLLSGGVVTIYQLALIEAGNVDGLMLGPVRVVDRLRVADQEVVYRVFDPRRGREAVLRHLSADMMHDAVRPDEFRQRFSQACRTDPHLAATHEVLELTGRPAVLQEWLTGLPATDWPPLAAAPGVCFRLLTQAALGLATAHEAGLIHGHLDESSLLLTADGIVKICGLGEPAWLIGKPIDEMPTAANDLKSLGRIASSWCLPSGVRKGAKTKPLPEQLHETLERLASGACTSARQLLEDLDRAGSDVPANAEAWDRLLKYVREHQTPEALLKQTG